MQRWDYMTLCPDSQAGYEVMLRDVGDEGWEAVCAWVREGHTHILYKRPRTQCQKAESCWLPKDHDGDCELLNEL